MYKIIDRQGTGVKADEVFETKDDVRDALALYHSVDVAGTDEMTLDDLLDIGDWELVEYR